MAVGIAFARFAAAAPLVAAGPAAALLVGGLAFAAGAMIYVVVVELIPEANPHGNERLATFGFTVGFVLVLVLDNGLG